MGVALWIACGVLASLLARTIDAARPQSWWRELLLASTAAAVLGVAATAFDFGGWNELDWRAAAFTFAGALTAIATARLILLMQASSRASAESDRLRQ